jgi:hypothetical protein
MLWFISNPQSFIAAVSLHGRLVGDETGLWFAIGALFVAIGVIGGGLLVFLIRTIQASNREPVHSGPDTNGLATRNGNNYTTVEPR